MKIKIKKLLRSLIFIGLIWLIYQIIFLPNASEFKVKAPIRSAIMTLVEENKSKNNVSSIKYQYVSLDRISRSFRLAVLVAEDIDFPSHSGFAINEIYNSIVSALVNLRIPRGASTISQQLAKNLYLSPNKNPLRKIKEAIITYKIEQTLSKRRIFELYLNIVELGPGIFGVEAASQYWFSKPASALSELESAKLAAILPGPNTAFNPVFHARKVLIRQQILLKRMKQVALPSGL